jgi:glycosyltransferase involved in cell wall biosynthesis
MTTTDIVLAHDSLTQLGGAERVIEALHELYPQAPVAVIALDQRLAGRYKGWRIITSWLQPLYNLVPKLQYWLLLLPSAVSALRLPPSGVILSSSSGFIKGLRKSKGAVHVNYCHTPTRFLWSEPHYVDEEVPALIRPLVRLYLLWLRVWDFRAAQQVDYFVANSREVQARVKKYYNRDSLIIYPFVDTGFWRPVGPKQNYFLIGGRLQAHKGNELVIEIFNDLGTELHVVGTGRQQSYLQSLAKSNIRFLGRVSDEDLRAEYSGAKGFIFPQVEDFGLMPLEAAACGTATLALGQGGSLETVVPGVTGELFDRPDKELIRGLIASWNPSRYSPEVLRAHAEKFSKQVFMEKVKNYIREAVRP